MASPWMMGSAAPASSSRSRASRQSGYSRCHQAPEALRMVQLDEVRAPRARPRSRRARARRAPGASEADRAALGAHAPLRARVGERDARRGQAEQRGVVRRARRQRLERARLQPARPGARAARGGRRSRSRRRGCTAPSRTSSSTHLAEAAAATRRSRRAAARGRGTCAHSSSLARIQRSFSRTKPSMSRHGARSGADDLQAVGVDRDAERAPPPPREAVLDLAAAELGSGRAPSAALRSMSLARSLMVFGSRPAGSIGGPMRTVTVPGRLRNALRGQHRPALCATGTTGAPAAHGEPGAAGLVVAPRRPARCACLRERPRPRSPARGARGPLRDGAQRRAAARAVDRDRAHQREPPAEERNPQQLALQHQHLRREDELERHRLPRRLVLGRGSPTGAAAGSRAPRRASRCRRIALARAASPGATSPR